MAAIAAFIWAPVKPSRQAVSFESGPVVSHAGLQFSPELLKFGGVVGVTGVVVPVFPEVRSARGRRRRRQGRYGLRRPGHIDDGARLPVQTGHVVMSKCHLRKKTCDTVDLGRQNGGQSLCPVARPVIPLSGHE
jgi:hypothetical protein